MTMLEENVAKNQYLTFELNTEVYSIAINRVREVLEFDTVTKVPRTPEYMRGVINLRGSVVPVVDLKKKFGMGATEKTINTCVIILEIQTNENEQIIVGALTDSVQEVMELEPDEIEPPPSLGTKIKSEFISGMGKKDNKFLILLNTDRVFAEDELDSIVKDVNSDN